ncbi:hypothetical protein [Hamadaea tsunoensis]|uniref:hypothetical protein n=1 Tax=Hamadaea tsunoensis TaxID=53368 RepID=UPI000429E223|nr:hypothetical protein [Hamadaea tsunoensis]
MRMFSGTTLRLLGATAVAAGTLFAAGCSGTGTPDASASGTTAATGTPSAQVSLAPDVAANTKTVCASVKQVITDKTVEFSNKLVAALSDASSGGTKANQAVQQIKQLLTDWAAGLRQQADTAVEPNLKAALTTEAAAFDQAAAKVNSAADLQNAGAVLSGTDVTDAGEKVQQACGDFWVADLTASPTAS